MNKIILLIFVIGSLVLGGCNALQGGDDESPAPSPSASAEAKAPAASPSASPSGRSTAVVSTPPAKATPSATPVPPTAIPATQAPPAPATNTPVPTNTSVPTQQPAPATATSTPWIVQWTATPVPGITVLPYGGQPAVTATPAPQFVARPGACFSRADMEKIITISTPLIDAANRFAGAQGTFLIDIGGTEWWLHHAEVENRLGAKNGQFGTAWIRDDARCAP